MPMEHENYPCVETCLLNRTTALIDGKWEMRILYSLCNNDPTRCDQSKKILDRVSNTVLVSALRELEGDGLIHRQEYLEVPVRVEYVIAEPRRQFIPILDALGDQSMALQVQKGRRWSLRPDR